MTFERIGLAWVTSVVLVGLSGSGRSASLAPLNLGWGRADSAGTSGRLIVLYPVPPAHPLSATKCDEKLSGPIR